MKIASSRDAKSESRVEEHGPTTLLSCVEFGEGEPTCTGFGVMVVQWYFKKAAHDRGVGDAGRVARPPMYWRRCSRKDANLGEGEQGKQKKRGVGSSGQHVSDVYCKTRRGPYIP